MRNKNIAVVGCGYWGKNLVRNFFELGSLKSLYDYDDNTAVGLAKSYGVESSSFQQILNDNQIKGVVVATPAIQHFKIAKDCILAGKNVFVEKPLALNIEDANELVELSEQNNVEIMVGHLLRYHPVFIELLRITKQGRLGDIFYISSTRHSFGKMRQEEDVVWSFAPHDISMILALAGIKPKSVFTNGVSIYQDNILDKALINLTFAENLKAHISVSWIHPEKEQKLVVVGSKGLAIFNDREPWDKKLIFCKTDINIDSKNFDYKIDEGEYLAVKEDEPLRNECKYFLGLIEGKIKPLTNGLEGISVLKVLKGATDSANHNKKIVIQ